MSYVLAIHVPIAGLALVPVLLKWPLVLLPVHIVFLELIIDPACSVAFEAEAEEANVMRRPPRDPQLPLFDSSHLASELPAGRERFSHSDGGFCSRSSARRARDQHSRSDLYYLHHCEPGVDPGKPVMDAAYRGQHCDLLIRLFGG